MHCIIWFAGGSGCLDIYVGTDCSEGVVVVVAQETDPVVVFWGGPSRCLTVWHQIKLFIMIFFDTNHWQGIRWGYRPSGWDGWG